VSTFFGKKVIHRLSTGRGSRTKKKPGVFVDEGMSYSGRMCFASVLLRAKRGACSHFTRYALLRAIA